MNRPVDVVFPEAKADRDNGICPMCKEKIGEFQDELSEKEFQISGMCQRCQDEVFLDE